MNQEEQKRPGMSQGMRNILIALGLFVLTLGATAVEVLLKSHHDRPAIANVMTLALINLNILLLGILLLVIGRHLAKFYFERKKSPFGAGFRTKLVMSFVGLSIVPAGILFFAATGLLVGGVKFWFGPNVENTVKSSVRLSETYRQDRLDSAELYARNVAVELGLGDEEAPLAVIVDKARARYGLDMLAVYDAEGGIVAASGEGPEFEDVYALLADTGVSPTGTAVSAADEGGMYLGSAAYSPLPEMDAPTGEPPERYTVVAGFKPPEEVTEAVGTISNFYEEYWGLRMFKNPLRESYTISFILLTLVTVFAAIWFGLYLSRNITVPITTLADATQRISRGEYDFDIDVEARDELGALVDSFRRMTRELKSSQERITEANISLKESNELLGQRTRFIETVLENVNTGVVTIDRTGKISTANRATGRITGLDPEDIVGRGYQEVFEIYELGELREQVGTLDTGSHAGVEKEIKLKVNRRTLELRLFVCPLHDVSGKFLGILVVFDDLTNLIKAQRAAAWREAARRIAHEIKNPLTPIQLSAQRLRKRCLEIEGECGKIIDDSTRTIVSQVESMRALVDEFSDFARMPEPNPAPMGLMEVVDETVTLYAGAHRGVTPVVDIDPDMPPLMADKDQVKRVLVNLFDNAVKAMDGEGRVWISARPDTGRGVAVIEFADEGAGILPEDRDKLFLPYFSKDKTGTGLGLAIVNRIVTDHAGQIRVEGNRPKGARFIIELPLAAENGSA